jgi:hypothetical protein
MDSNRHSNLADKRSNLTDKRLLDDSDDENVDQYVVKSALYRADLETFKHRCYKIELTKPIVNLIVRLSLDFSLAYLSEPKVYLREKNYLFSELCKCGKLNIDIVKCFFELREKHFNFVCGKNDFENQLRKIFQVGDFEIIKYVLENNYVENFLISELTLVSPEHILQLVTIPVFNSGLYYAFDEFRNVVTYMKKGFLIGDGVAKDWYARLEKFPTEYTFLGTLEPAIFTIGNILLGLVEDENLQRLTVYFSAKRDLNKILNPEYESCADLSSKLRNELDLMRIQNESFKKDFKINFFKKLFRPTSMSILLTYL